MSVNVMLPTRAVPRPEVIEEVNRTVTVQVPPGASDVPVQLSAVAEKPQVLLPEVGTFTPVMFICAPPFGAVLV